MSSYRLRFQEHEVVLALLDPHCASLSEAPVELRDMSMERAALQKVS
jgi:hypothetical protein